MTSQIGEKPVEPQSRQSPPARDPSAFAKTLWKALGVPVEASQFTTPATAGRGGGALKKRMAQGGTTSGTKKQRVGRR